MTGEPPKLASSRFDPDGSCRGKGDGAAPAAPAESLSVTWTPPRGLSSKGEQPLRKR